MGRGGASSSGIVRVAAWVGLVDLDMGGGGGVGVRGCSRGRGVGRRGWRWRSRWGGTDRS